jgi:branched-chain amino acid transport system permease protein
VIVLDSYAASVAIFLGINVLLALSLYIPMSAGQISLGHGGFMAIGAYTCAVLASRIGMPFAVALLVGGLAAAAAGLIVGFPALRIRGIYLIILTLGFGEIVRIFFLNFEPTGGPSGLTGIKQLTTLPVVAVACAIAAIIGFQLRRSRSGRAMLAVEEDEVAAGAMGVNVVMVKLASFAGGAFFAGVAGGLYAHHALFIEPGEFGFYRSAEIFLSVILGGVTTPWGPIGGAAFVTLVPEALRFIQDWRMTFFGMLLVAMAIWRPEGLMFRRQAMR